MRSFKKVVKEIHAEIEKIILFAAIMDSIIIFLLGYFILSLFNYHPLYSMIPAFIYFGIMIYNSFRVNKVRILEMASPNLNEKLRTAADHAHLDGEVVDELHKEVVHDLKKISAGRLFNTQKNFIRIFIAIFMCFIIIFSSSLNINLTDYVKKIVDSAKKARGEQDYRLGGDDSKGDGGDMDIVGTKGNDNIFGSKSVAKLGDEEINVEIRSAKYEFNIREMDETEVKEFKEQFPTDITPTEAETFRENIPEDQMDLVKSYFKKITEG